jgi:hypothetical protein
MRTAVETKSVFHVALEALRTHHLDGQGGDFFAAQPQFQSLITTNAVLTGDDQAASEILRPVLEELASQQRAVADAIRIGLNDAVNGLKASKNVSDFEVRLAALRQKGLQDSSTNIDAAFDNALQLGQNADQATQSVILAGLNEVQKIITRFTSLISDMVSKAVSRASDILMDNMSLLEGDLNDFTSGAEGLLKDLP